MNCPYCDAIAYAEFVDVGVGHVQVTPYQCECGAEQFNPSHELITPSKIEMEFGWHAPYGYCVECRVMGEPEYIDDHLGTHFYCIRCPKCKKEWR